MLGQWWELQLLGGAQFVVKLLICGHFDITPGMFREALFPGLDLDSGLDWTLDWTHGLWLNSALEHSLKPDQLVDALAIAPRAGFSV